jgi:hypothetical protein
MNWNRASEILPENGERVLVCTEHPIFGREKTFVRDVTIAEYRSEAIEPWKCKEYLANRVLAWARLPEVPEEV